MNPSGAVSGPMDSSDSRGEVSEGGVDCISVIDERVDERNIICGYLEWSGECEKTCLFMRMVWLYPYMKRHGE